MAITKSHLYRFVGVFAMLFALSPLLYSLLNNIPDTGNEAADKLAEGTHDMLMYLLTFATALKAISVLFVMFIIIYLIPDSVFERKKSELAPTERNNVPESLNASVGAI